MQNRWQTLKMKNKILRLILSLTILSNINAQTKNTDLLGSWIQIKTEMKDSSELIPVYKDYIKHFDMTFEKKKYHTNYYPAQKFKNATNNYKLKKNKIVASKHYALEIEKLTRDSLVIVEQMKGLDDDKLKRHYLIKKERIFSEQKAIYQGLNKITANPYYTPLFIDNIQLYLSRGLNKSHTNLNLKGVIKIYPKNKDIKTVITFSDKKGLYQENIIVDLLNNSYPSWDLKHFENYDEINIEFVILIHRKGKNSYGLKIGLLTNSFNQLKGLYGLTYTQITDGNKYLKSGIDYYNAKDYKNAIKDFTKSFESNHTLVDALYNRAICYYENKQYLKACLDWKTLSDLGQKRAQKLFEENCELKR